MYKKINFKKAQTIEELIEILTLLDIQIDPEQVNVPIEFNKYLEEIPKVEMQIGTEEANFDPSEKLEIQSNPPHLWEI